eukprot:m51a1_g14089 hypothetical protein (328) ;mRNA; f:37176-38300
MPEIPRAASYALILVAETAHCTRQLLVCRRLRALRGRCHAAEPLLLDDATLARVLAMLRAPEDLASAAATCRRWYSVAHSSAGPQSQRRRSPRATAALLWTLWASLAVLCLAHASAGLAWAREAAAVALLAVVAASRTGACEPTVALCAAVQAAAWACGCPRPGLLLAALRGSAVALAAWHPLRSPECRWATARRAAAAALLLAGAPRLLVLCEAEAGAAAVSLAWLGLPAGVPCVGLAMRRYGALMRAWGADEAAEVLAGLSLVMEMSAAAAARGAGVWQGCAALGVCALCWLSYCMCPACSDWRHSPALKSSLYATPLVFIHGVR